MGITVDDGSGPITYFSYSPGGGGSNYPLGGGYPASGGTDVATASWSAEASRAMTPLSHARDSRDTESRPTFES